MRVVRFYQTSCSPPRLAILLLLLRQHLLDHLCLHFHVHCCLANFAKLFANVRAQCAPLTSTWDLPSSVGTAGPQPGPSQLSGHRSGPRLRSSGAHWVEVQRCTLSWGTSTWTCPAQCAPLDLNLGPSQLSGHRWTSTWDLPSSVSTAGPQPGTCPAQCAPLDLNPVCTAGPQPGTCPAQCAPLDLNGQIECQKICQIECQIRMPEDKPDKMPEDMPDRMP